MQIADFIVDKFLMQQRQKQFPRDEGARGLRKFRQARLDDEFCTFDACVRAIGGTRKTAQ